MKMVYVMPKKRPVTIDMANELSVYQDLVGGFIEVIYPFDDNAVLVCNEEGKLNGSSFNRYLYRDNEPYDALMGSFFIVGDDGEGDFCSLTDEQIKKYTDMFYEIEEETHPHLSEPNAWVTSFETIDDLLKILYG